MLAHLKSLSVYLSQKSIAQISRTISNNRSLLYYLLPRDVLHFLLVVVLLKPTGPAGQVSKNPGEVSDPRGLERDASVVSRQTDQRLHELHLDRMDDTQAFPLQKG